MVVISLIYGLYLMGWYPNLTGMKYFGLYPTVVQGRDDKGLDQDDNGGSESEEHGLDIGSMLMVIGPAFPWRVLVPQFTW